MLASCESKWGYEKQYDIFRWRMGTTTRGKEERQMGSIVWKRRLPQKVLEKHWMKKKSIKSKLKSVERERVMECGMNFRSTKRGGGFGSAEWNRGEPIQAEEHQCDCGVLISVEEHQWDWGVLIQAEELWKRLGKKCGNHYRSAGGNRRAPIPG